MVKSVEGIYRNGRVELMEPLAEAEGSRVIVTWVQSAEPVDLRAKGINERQAADLRRRLNAFSEDWIGLKWLPTMNCRRGDIVLVLFPDSNLQTSKRRPAVVVQSDELGAGLPQTIVAMITSTWLVPDTRAERPCGSIAKARRDRVY